MTSLPQLAWLPSPNESGRLHNAAPYLIVWHRPVGRYRPSIDWLRNPRAQASAHVITEGNGTGVDQATQLVAWHRKAWHACAFNDYSYGIEGDDDAWDGDDASALLSVARLTAFLCWRTGIPCQQAKRPTHDAGIATHAQLGRAGGGHADPTTDPAVIRHALQLTRRELDRGGFRHVWGRGNLRRLPAV